MQRCQNCGRDNPNDARFCNMCGRPLMQQMPPQPPMPQQPMQPYVMGPQQQQMAPPPVQTAPAPVQPTQPVQPVMQQGQQAPNMARVCIKCGRPIDFYVNVCPYCGHDYRYKGR